MNFKVRTGEGSIPASRDLSVALNQWFEKHGPGGIFTTCENCKHMTTSGPAFCGLYQMTPPAAVIVAGCPSHEDIEEIPF